MRISQRGSAFLPFIQRCRASPHMPSRGAAQFRIGSYAYRNMVLRFSHLSSLRTSLPAKAMQPFLGFNAPLAAPRFPLSPPALHIISPHMPSAGPRRSASDHAHIATWFCIFPVYPALPHFAAYASPGGGAASPGLQRTACSPTLPSFSPALHIISPHMPSRKTAPFRIRLCTYHNMILRLSVYASSSDNASIFAAFCFARRCCAQRYGDALRNRAVQHRALTL